MQPARQQKKPEAVRLISGDYTPSLMDAPPVRLLSQVVLVSGFWEHAWVDGLDMQQPSLVPLEYLVDVREEGTLAEYVLANTDLVRQILRVSPPDASPTLLVRACEILRVEGGSPDSAYGAAVTWCRALLDMDEMDRMVMEMMLPQDQLISASSEAPRY